MEYYFNIGGKQKGPFDIREFRELVKNKSVAADDHVWDAKQGKWSKIKVHPELNKVFEEETVLAEAEDDGFFINVEGKTGGPFPRDAIIKEVERGRFKGTHFVWDGVANRWLKASEHPLFSQFFAPGTKAAAKKYYLSKDGERFGPFEFADVEEKIAAGEFDQNHYVWEYRLKKWVKIGDVADFADIFVDLVTREPVVPPPIPEATPPPPGSGPATPERVAPPFTAAIPPAPATPEPPPAARPQRPPSPGAPPAPPAPVGPSPVAPSAPVFAAAPPTPFGPSPAAPLGVGVPPLTPVGAPPAPPRPEAKVGDLVTISIPEAPATPQPPAPGKVALDEAAFRRVTAPETAVKGKDVKVDRSVILDFSRPGIARRVAAQFVDLFIVGLSYFAVALVFSFLDMNPFMPGPDQYYFQQLFWATLGGVAVFYFLVRDAGGASIGKRIMGLRVVKYNDFNRPAGLFHSIVRNLTLLVPLVNILEVVYVFSDAKGRRMGDRAAGTVLTETTEIDYVRQQQGILDEIY